MLTSTSMRPNRSTAAWTAASASAGSVTSSLTASRSSCVAERSRDPLGVAAGGDHSVAGGQRGLGDVDAHAAAGAGDEPNLLVSHASALPSVDLRVGHRSSAAHPPRNQPARERGRPCERGTDRDPQPRGSARRVEDMAGRNDRRLGDIRGDVRATDPGVPEHATGPDQSRAGRAARVRRRPPTGLRACAARRSPSSPASRASTTPGSSAATPPASPTASSTASRTHCSSMRPSERICSTSSAPPARPVRRAAGRRRSGSGPRCSASWTR